MPHDWAKTTNGLTDAQPRSGGQARHSRAFAEIPSWHLRGGTKPGGNRAGTSDLPQDAVAAARRVKKAKKRAAKLERRAARFEENGQHRKALRAQRQMLGSYDAAVVAHDRQNSKPGVQLQHRKSDRVILGRAKVLNVFKLDDDPIAVRMEPKPKGGVRPVYQFRLPNLARAELLNMAMRPFVGAPDERIYSAKGAGGRLAAVRAAHAEIIEGEHSWVVAFDIKDFFASLDHDQLRSWLRPHLPERVIELVVLPTELDLSFNSIWERSEYEIEQAMETIWRQIEGTPAASNVYYPDDSEASVVIAWASRGVPPGSPVSALIAEMIMTSIAKMLPANVRTFIYADDGLIACRTKKEARACAEALESALRAAPVGPLTTSRLTIRHVSWGFTWLGFRFIRRVGCVPLQPTEEKLTEFHEKFETLLENARKGQIDWRDVRRYVCSWCAAFQPWLGADPLRREKLQQVDVLP